MRRLFVGIALTAALSLVAAGTVAKSARKTVKKTRDTIEFIDHVEDGIEVADTVHDVKKVTEIATGGVEADDVVTLTQDVVESEVRDEVRGELFDEIEEAVIDDIAEDAVKKGLKKARKSVRR